MWVDSSVVTIPPFWVDVPMSSQRVRFSTQMTRTEADDKERNSDQRACQQVRTLVVEKYSRFL